MFMNHEINHLLQEMNLEQEISCKYEGSYVLTACPGSGKTRTIINRLVYLTSKYSKSRLKNIALTHTNRAAEEMLSRISDLGIENDAIWIGTIHQFCLEYILHPYGRYLPELQYGFEIINEYEQREILNSISNSLNYSFKTYDRINNILAIPLIRKEYLSFLRERNKIDFDMILEYSLKILTENVFIPSNLSRIIRSIQVDEYQDTNLYQYDIIERIFTCNKSIYLSFVGDPNQAIYRGLGSLSLSVEELERKYGTKFNDLKLKNCYRSPQNIVDYFIKYQNHQEKIQSLKSSSNDENLVLLNNIDVQHLSNQLNEIILNEVARGIKIEDICILTAHNFHAMAIGNQLRDINDALIINSPTISSFLYDPLSPFYLMAKLLFTPPGINSKIRKKNTKTMIELLDMVSSTNFDSNLIYNVLKIINSTPYSSDGLEMLSGCATNIFTFLYGTLYPKQLQDALVIFLEETTARINRNKLSRDTESITKQLTEKRGIVISTYHGVKGEEYDTVICTGLLDGYIPHWDLIYNETRENQILESNYLLYVAFSRAKDKIIIIPEIGRRTNRGYTLVKSKSLQSF